MSDKKSSFNLNEEMNQEVNKKKNYKTNKSTNVGPRSAAIFEFFD